MTDYQVSSRKSPPEVWTLTLDRYQRDNLLQLLQAAMEGDKKPLHCYNTGDWIGEIRWMLGKVQGPGSVEIFCIDQDDSPLTPHEP